MRSKRSRGFCRSFRIGGNFRRSFARKKRHARNRSTRSDQSLAGFCNELLENINLCSGLGIILVEALLRTVECDHRSLDRSFVRRPCITLGFVGSFICAVDLVFGCCACGRFCASSLRMRISVTSHRSALLFDARHLLCDNFRLRVCFGE